MSHGEFWNMCIICLSAPLISDIVFSAQLPALKYKLKHAYLKMVLEKCKSLLNK